MSDIEELDFEITQLKELVECNIPTSRNTTIDSLKLLLFHITEMERISKNLIQIEKLENKRDEESRNASSDE